MSASSPRLFLCNGAQSPVGTDKAKVAHLTYLRNHPNRNVNLQLPNFVRQCAHLPSRLLDLLEIAGYIFAADRMTSRGSNQAVELHAWQRDMRFIIRVQDPDFWNQESVKEKLAAALLFMTGDGDYSFHFEPGHSTAPASLFDSEEFVVPSKGPSSIVLFSGGLDSLAGVIDRLESTKETLFLISHRSGQSGTKRTQNRLLDSLTNAYPGRVLHFSFDCGLFGYRAEEETQRTRAFLFCSIAFALAKSLSLDSIFVYENGITSLNLLRRQDLIGARASRTTHPKTNPLMSQFLSEVSESRFTILNPFWNRTKTDLMELLNQLNSRDLIGSAVSCSRTFQRVAPATHCGGCFQCIDRRLAAYAAGIQDIDDVGIYSRDIFRDEMESETRTTAMDYVRQAIRFAEQTVEAFELERLSELAEITDYLPGKADDAVEAVWDLCHRHGQQVVTALKQIRHYHDNLCRNLKNGSLLQLISNREYLKSDARRLAEEISDILVESIPVAFANSKPKSERELNDQIDALIRARREDFRREFPATTFCSAKVVPDHNANTADLIIEAKYIRGGTSPSKATEGIAADITKYPRESFVLFVIYDPERAISDDGKYKKDIQNRRDCLVTIIR
ncbi:MAG TPA: hypothetical protein PLY86_01840 [bacterium]|nr:hypothetical protein [bacterium]